MKFLEAITGLGDGLCLILQTQGEQCVAQSPVSYLLYSSDCMNIQVKPFI